MLRGIREGMKPIMWVVIIAFVGAIFLWGASTGIKLFTERRASTIAKVDGEAIKRDEFFIEMQREYALRLREARKQYQGNITKDMDNYLRTVSAQKTLEMLIYRQSLLNIAERMGIKIADDVIRDRVISSPAFQRGGEFDIELYRELLASELYMTPAEFEENLRKEMVCSFVIDIVASNSRISAKEVEELIRDSLTTADIEYVKIPVEKYKDDVKLGEDDVISYYQEHKERYWKPERVKVKYIYIDINEIAKDIEVSEKQMRAYYEQHKNDYLDMGMIHTRQILIAVPKDASPSEDARAKEKALRVIAELNSGADFSELAKKYSDHPSSSLGGDLGFYMPGQWGDEFDRNALELNAGEYTKEPVRDEEGYHIILREEDVPPYDEQKENIKEILTRAIAEERAEKKAQEVYESVKGGNSIDVEGMTLGLKVVETDYFSKDGFIKELGRMPSLANEAFKLNIGDVGRVLPITQSIAYAPPQLTGYIVFQVMDKKPSEIARIEDVREQVEKDALREKAFELALEEVENINRSRANGELTLEYIAEMTGEKIERRENISKGMGAPGIGNDFRILDSIFNLEIGKVSKPLRCRDGVCFVLVKSVKEPTDEEIEKHLSSTLKSMRESIRQGIYMDFYTALRNKVEVKMDVKELLAPQSEEEQAEMLRRMRNLMQ